MSFRIKTSNKIPFEVNTAPVTTPTSQSIYSMDYKVPSSSQSAPVQISTPRSGTGKGMAIRQTRGGEADNR